MKIVFCFMLTCFGFMNPAFLDQKKVYPIIKEVCTYRGASYDGSNTLDISNMDLESLNGISVLIVEFEGEEIFISKVPRLRIVAQDNRLKTIPYEINMLDLVAIDLTNNHGLDIPKWMFESKSYHLYCCYGFFRRSL